MDEAFDRWFDENYGTSSGCHGPDELEAAFKAGYQAGYDEGKINCDCPTPLDLTRHG